MGSERWIRVGVVLEKTSIWVSYSVRLQSMLNSPSHNMCILNIVTPQDSPTMALFITTTSGTRKGSRGLVVVCVVGLLLGVNGCGCGGGGVALVVVVNGTPVNGSPVSGALEVNGCLVLVSGGGGVVFGCRGVECVEWVINGCCCCLVVVVIVGRLDAVEGSGCALGGGVTV